MARPFLFSAQPLKFWSRKARLLVSRHQPIRALQTKETFSSIWHGWWILQPRPSATGSFILSSTMMMSKYSLLHILRPFRNERSDVGDNDTERQNSPTVVATLACFPTLPSEEAKDGRTLRLLLSLRRSSQHTSIR